MNDAAVKLAQDKNRLSSVELITYVESLNLASTDLIQLWDNLFYQTIVQEDFYVKERLIEILVLLHVTDQLKNNQSNDKTALLIQALNARVVLPVELFDNTNYRTQERLVQSKSALSKSKSSIISRELATAVENDRLKNEIDILEHNHSRINSLVSKYRELYDEAYKKEYSSYQQSIRTELQDYQTRYDQEYRKLYSELKDKEQVEILLNVEAPEIPEFKFDRSPNASIEDITGQMDEEVLAQLTVMVDVSGSGNMDELLTNIERQIDQREKQIAANNINTGTVFALGKAVFPKALGTSNGSIAFTFCNRQVRIWDGGNINLRLSLQVPSTSYVVSKFIYTYSYADGNNTNGGYTDLQAGDIIMLEDLFSNSISVSSLNSPSSFSGEITFTNGEVYTFEIDPFNFKDCHEGFLTLEEEDDDNGGDGNGNSSGSGNEVATPPSANGYRQLGIADYKKVVSEICCYETGEVAHIENVMARELREKVSTKFHQRQVIETESSTIETEQITDTASTERFEMQSEVNKILQEQRQFQGEVNVNSSWGNTTLDTSAGYASNTSKEQSNRYAVQEGKQITERASENVFNSSTKERTVSTTDEYTEENIHRFDNTQGDQHISGVFRYVNAIYKNQVLNYGKRLMYEFMVPQPSQLHRLAMAVTRSSSSITTLEKPVDPRVNGYTDFTKINRANYQILAAQYDAEVTPHKEQYINVSAHHLNDRWENGGRWQKADKFTVDIPEDYIVARVNGYFDPFHGNHGATWGNMRGTILIGGRKIDVPGSIETLVINEIGFGSSKISESLKISLTSWDIGYYNFNLKVMCEIGPEAYRMWQQETFTAIMRGYQEQMRVYEERLGEVQTQNGINIESNPLFYRDIEQEVLKSNCISYLLEDAPDSLRKFGMGMYDDQATFKNYKVKQGAALDAYTSFAKFMEQAFEWKLMSYNFYPYYWGNKNDWQSLYQFEGTDKIFREFMRAGMARVIVTVKPSFEDAVMHFMATGQIWNGGSLPVLGDPLYLSIVDELREQEYVVDETWTTVLPTKLIALQKSGVSVDATGLPCDPDCDEADGKNLKASTALMEHGGGKDEEMRLIENMDIEDGYLKLKTDDEPRQTVAQISIEAIKRAMT